MSASNEMQNNQEQELTSVSKKEARKAVEQQERKQQKRNNALYIVIGAVFAVAVAFAIIWNTGMIQKNSTAVTIDGEKYTADEVQIYYLNAFSAFVNNNYYYIDYLGLDYNSALETQPLNETAALYLGMDLTTAGKMTWHDVFLNEAVTQMTTVQNTLKVAEETGFVFPESVQREYDETIGYIQISASYAGLSEDEYLTQYFGADIKADVYYEQMLRLMQVDAYMADFEAGLNFTEEEMEAVYAADSKSYDKAVYEYLAVSGNVESTTDAEGNTVEPTEEERAAAMDAARAQAEALLAEYQKGGKTLSEMRTDDITHYQSHGASYYAGTLLDWVFDDARVKDDVTVLEAGTTVYVVRFEERTRQEYNTVNVRHVLITPATGELVEGDEGYEAEQEQLNAEAKAKAEELLAQWKAGEATEDAFAKLANENSADSDGTDGGLYTKVYKGQMVAEFEDWCFDESRKAGDTGIVETTYGFHIMYFSGEDLPYWQSVVMEELVTEAYAERISELSAGSVVKYNDFGMGFVSIN